MIFILMKRIVTLILLCLFFSQSYSQFNLLKEAYKKKSEEKLDEFFVNWQKEIPSISNEEFEKLSEIEKEAYNVFCVFYNPINLQTIGNSEWGDTIYKSVKYLVVQNSLQYRVQNKVYFTDEEKREIYKKHFSKGKSNNIDSIALLNIPNLEEYWSLEELFENETLYSDTITNFHPPISLNNKGIVYLNSMYDMGLTTFLGTRIKKNKERLHYSYYLSDKEVEKRQLFLEQNIKIWRGHWGAYWQLLTYPQINVMVFDKDLTFVKIFFRIVYQGGETVLKKENGKWTLLSSKLTWIE